MSKTSKAAVVTGISPKEATPGTKITIRGENLGTNPADLLGVLILGSDCLLTTEWKSANKLIALCPAPKDGASSSSGDIVVATKSGGIGSCTVQLRVYRETIAPLKEVSVWMHEKFYSRHKTRLAQQQRDGGGSEDALGLSVEGVHQGIPEDKLRQMFPGRSGDIASENFEPIYFLLENHQGTTFEDLQAGLGFLRRKVDGENESQLSFIKANVSSIMDQLDTLKSIKRRYEVDKAQGEDIERVEAAISAAKREADKMFIDVLGRKDRADATRNALNVLQRFKFLFNLPANNESNLSKGDYDRIIDEYERAKSLYDASDSDIFNVYLEEVEKSVHVLKKRLEETLNDPLLGMEQQKKLIGNLVQLKVDGDPAWDCLKLQYGRCVSALDDCQGQHVDKLRRQSSVPDTPSSLVLSPPRFLSTSSKDVEDVQHQPQAVLFVQDVTDRLGAEFPALWKLGQAYFKGELVVEPDSGKAGVFKELILTLIRHFATLVRAAVIPQTLSKEEQEEATSVWKAPNTSSESTSVAQWLPSCLRHVRKSYAAFVELDLPQQALTIIKRLTTDLRIQCLQMIFQTVIDQVHLLHEKEDWRTDTTDEFGAITQIPAHFETLVSQSVQLIKEALLTSGASQAEEDILSYQNAHEDLELLIENVLSSFAFTLENAAVENYASLSKIPSDSMRLLLCLNNCRYTQSHVLPTIQKSFQDVGQRLSLERPIADACRKYTVLHDKLLEAYLELKCDPIVAIIEPSMYVGKFDWARCPKPTDARDYVKEILHNVIAVHGEVERVSMKGFAADVVLPRLVESVAEEVNRLFCCINRMNSNGCIQAWVDIHCLQTALKAFLTKTAGEFLSDAAKPLYDLERPGDKEVVDTCVREFERRMKFHRQVLKY